MAEKEFRFVMEKYGFQQNATNFVNHRDGLLKMKHSFSFSRDIWLFYELHGCILTFYKGPAFDEEFFKRIIKKWQLSRTILNNEWEGVYTKNKHYIMDTPKYYRLHGDLFSMRGNETQSFSPAIFPLLSLGDKSVEWKMKENDYLLMGFELEGEDEKSSVLKHKSKNLRIGFSSVNIMFADLDNKKYIEIENMVHHKCKTLEIFRIYNLLNH